MKYIKTYERIRIDDKRNISKILAEYPPGCYMIYTNKSFDWKIKKEVNQLILGQIIKIEEHLVSNNLETYINIRIIDMINEYDIDNIKENEYYRIFNIKDNIIFKSTSLKTTK